MKLVNNVHSTVSPLETEINVDTAYRRFNIHTIEREGETYYEYDEEQYTLPEYFGIIIPQMQAEIEELKEKIE